VYFGDFPVLKYTTFSQMKCCTLHSGGRVTDKSIMSLVATCMSEDMKPREIIPVCTRNFGINLIESC
jgi:hypothetical protein